MGMFLQENPWLMLLILLWVLPWEGYALWTAAKRGEKWWFIALLVLNTLALFEIFYIFVIAKKGRRSHSSLRAPQSLNGLSLLKSRKVAVPEEKEATEEK